MALLTRTQLRQRIQTAVATIAGLRVSAFAPELFGDDSAREMAGRFAVGLGVTEPAPQDRQLRTAEGVYVQTPVIVRLAHKLRADAQVADLDAASNAADTAIIKVMAPGNLAACQIYFVRANQELTPQAEFILSTLEFLVYHRVPTV
ncbi:MAG: hypothetical protein EBZ78_02400 [Verrucomicrobia bacterium]|nr:hypothetical protein [Verrucomicrobiota bacterium]